LHSIIFLFYLCIVNFENIQSQMRKGVLEYCIMAIIAREEIYASDILIKLKEASLIVVEGTLYPLLTRLKNAGLLNYRWVESLQGPPRKYYAITESGTAFLTELDKTWKDLNDSVRIATGK
jgi:PadR family transcriptional regulator, regulatory protein PadR